MVRLTCIFVALAASSAAVSLQATAQEPPVVRDQGPQGLAGSTEPDPLPGLPRPPDQPKTLFQPAPAAEMYGCLDLECPYFDEDPRLDCTWGQPGWLFDLETQILGTHVINHLGENINTANGIIFPAGGGANVPMAPLSWTVSPRFEWGYRLPSAFGEIDVSYRFLAAHGSGTAPMGLAATPDAPAALTSHLSLDVGDLDYASHETSLGPWWLMKWRIGLRTAGVSFDSQAVEPPATAAAPGSGTFKRSIENDYSGIGPHAALELKSRRSPWGLGVVGKLDGGLLFGRTEQEFVRVATAGAGTEVDYTNQEQAPMLSGFLGLDWRIPSHPNLEILFGSTAEYWWNVGRMSDPDLYNGTSAGEVGAYGALLRVEYNY